MVDSNIGLSRGLTIGDSQSGLTTVEVFTTSHKITGQLARGRLRISDVFNQVERQSVTIDKAVVTALMGDRGPIEAGEAQVATRQVVFVIPHDAGRQQPTQDPQPERTAMRVTKDRYPVVVEASPFTIAGSIHLIKETKVRDALVAIPSLFIPLTSATVTIAGSTSAPITAEAVIVNRLCIHAMYAEPVPASPPQSSGILLRRTPR